ncbi:MAG: MFS transporter [Gaiellales bacterium]
MADGDMPDGRDRAAAQDEAERLGPAPPTPRAQGTRRLLSLATLDVGPLRRHRDFRLLWLGQGVSFLGSMVTYVALPFQAYELTHSSLVVGLMGLAELAPLLISALAGGALADAIDRRMMVRLTEGGLAGCSGLLVVNSLLPHPAVWVLFVLSAVMASLDGLQRPSLDALAPRLVERDELMAAGALNTFRMTVGMVAGPALGGLLIAAIGLPATYGFDVVTFGASLSALAMMRAVPPPPEAERPSLRRVLDGWAYARSRPELIGTYAVDIVAMFFGMPNALFPAVASSLGGPKVLGLLYAAPAVGALLATVTSGWTAHVRRHGAAVCLSAIGWGLGIVVFGLSHALPLALVGLCLAGVADTLSGLFRSVIWNRTIPDHLRGRLAGIEQVSYSTGPLLGDVEAGVVASLAGVRASIVSGGVLCVAGVVVAVAALPAFWRYVDRGDPAQPVVSHESV